MGDFSSLDSAMPVGGDVFGATRSRFSIVVLKRNEGGNFKRFQASEDNPATTGIARIRLWGGFRIGDDNGLTLDEKAGWPSELPILRDKVSILIEDLKAIVIAIGDPEPSLIIKPEGVRKLEFSLSRAELAHALMNLPSLVNLTMRALESGLIE